MEGRWFIFGSVIRNLNWFRSWGIEKDAEDEDVRLDPFSGSRYDSGMKFLNVVVVIVMLGYGGLLFSQEEKAKPKGPDPAALKAFEEKARKQMADRLLKRGGG